MKPRTDSALVVLDCQPGVLSRYPGSDATVGRIGEALTVARAAGMMTIFVTVALRSDGQDSSSRNNAFSRLASLDSFHEGRTDTEVDRRLEMTSDDVRIVKRRVGAFAGTELDQLLRANDIHTLVLAGVATSGAVLSTVRAAADLDYRLTVLSDGCIDGEAIVHNVLMDHLFPRQSRVITVSAWCHETAVTP